jgi:hypothetical protein
MKIRIDRVKEIIREAVEEVIGEGGALCHDDKGHFSDCDSDATYSMSKDGAKRAGIDKKYVGRGKVSKRGKKKDGSYSLKSKMGLNTSKTKQGGRTRFPDGDPMSPKHSVSKYPKKYYTEDKDDNKTEWNPNWKSAKKRKADHKILKPSHTSWNPGKEELSQMARGVGLGLLEEIEDISIRDLLGVISEAFPPDEIDESQSQLRNKCKSMGLLTMGEAQKRILMSLDAFAKAHDGKLGESD